MNNEDKEQVNENSFEEQTVSNHQPGVNQEDGENERAQTQNEEEINALQTQIENIKEENEQLNDKYLRLAAEFENYKKKIGRERTEIRASAREEVIKEMLGIVDNLELALKHAQSETNAESIKEGITLVHRQLLSSLKKFGVEPISVSEGEQFDPKFHEGVERVESDEVAEGSIISERVKGYTIKDRLLRPSYVVVSKGKENDDSNKEN